MSAPGVQTAQDIAGLRLYRASVDAHWMLAKDGQPDHRIPVSFT